MADIRRGPFADITETDIADLDPVQRNALMDWMGRQRAGIGHLLDTMTEVARMCDDTVDQHLPWVSRMPEPFRTTILDHFTQLAIMNQAMRDYAAGDIDDAEYQAALLRASGEGAG